MTLSETATSRRIEVWYYGGVPITFRDVSGTGSYQLETLDLSQIQDLNLARAGEPGRTGYRSPGPLGRYSPDAQPLLDFSGEIREKLRLESRIEGLLRLEIPVRLIWFKSEGGRFQTTFEAVVRIRDGKNAVVWEKTTSAEAIYAEREIAARSGERHVIEIPILIDQAEAVAKLASSPVTVVVRLTNRTGSETVEKTIEWK